SCLSHYTHRDHVSEWPNINISPVLGSSLVPAVPITVLWNVRLPGHYPLARAGILLGQRRQRQDETPDNCSRQRNGPEGFKDRDCPEWFLVLVKKVLIRHRNLHSQSSRRQWVLHRAFASSPHC